MDHTTLKRDGGWTVELINPLEERIKELNIRPPTLDHTIRWGQGKIWSVLALLSDLTGVPEPLLRRLSGADSDRVLTAFSLLAPPLIKDDFQNGRRPLATPDEQKTDKQLYEDQSLDNDPDDPRFPRVEGTLKRFKEPEQPPQPQPDSGGMNVNPPEVMRRVG